MSQFQAISKKSGWFRALWKKKHNPILITTVIKIIYRPVVKADLKSMLKWLIYIRCWKLAVPRFSALASQRKFLEHRVRSVNETMEWDQLCQYIHEYGLPNKLTWLVMVTTDGKAMNSHVCYSTMPWKVQYEERDRHEWYDTQEVRSTFWPAAPSGGCSPRKSKIFIMFLTLNYLFYILCIQLLCLFVWICFEFILEPCTHSILHVKYR